MPQGGVDKDDKDVGDSGDGDDVMTYQSEEYTAKLDNVSVGHWVESPYPGVEDGDHRRHNDGGVNVHPDDDGESRS